MLVRPLGPTGRARVYSGYDLSTEPRRSRNSALRGAQQHHKAREAGNRNGQPVEDEQYRGHRPVDEYARPEIHLPSQFATMNARSSSQDNEVGTDVDRPRTAYDCQVAPIQPIVIMRLTDSWNCHAPLALSRKIPMTNRTLTRTVALRIQTCVWRYSARLRRSPGTADA